MANYDLTYEGSRVQGILDTGDELRDAGYIFRGEATPSTVPGTPTERVAYIGGPGTYTNFGSSITVGDGCICVFKYTGSAWSNQVINTGLSDAISSEASARQLGDTTLQQNINAEAQARQLGDSTLQGGINSAMQAVNAINNAITNGSVYAGIATPSSTPVSGKVFYLAFTAGTYTNFNNLEVPQGINILKNNGSTWLLDSFLGIDDAPIQGSANLVKSGGVLNSIIQNGPAFDLSAYNAQGGVLATYADLSAALTALNALPADFKKGGMSIKFVLSSDNKYVQYRLMSDSFNTTSANWQGVDDEPLAGSNNLVKSGGIYNDLQDINTWIKIVQTDFSFSNISDSDIYSPYLLSGNTFTLLIDEAIDGGTQTSSQRLYGRPINNVGWIDFGYVIIGTKKNILLNRDFKFIRIGEGQQHDLVRGSYSVLRNDSLVKRVSVLEETTAQNRTGINTLNNDLSDAIAVLGSTEPIIKDFDFRNTSESDIYSPYFKKGNKVRILVTEVKDAEGTTQTRIDCFGAPPQWVDFGRITVNTEKVITLTQDLDFIRVGGGEVNQKVTGSYIIETDVTNKINNVTNKINNSVPISENFVFANTSDSDIYSPYLRKDNIISIIIDKAIDGGNQTTRQDIYGKPANNIGWVRLGIATVGTAIKLELEQDFKFIRVGSGQVHDLVRGSYEIFTKECIDNYQKIEEIANVGDSDYRLKTQYRVLVLGDSFSQDGGQWTQPMIELLGNNSSVISLGVSSSTIHVRNNDTVNYPFTDRPVSSDNTGNHNCMYSQVLKLKRLMAGTDLDEGETAIYQTPAEYPNVIIIEGGMNDWVDESEVVELYTSYLNKVVTNVYTKQNTSVSEAEIGSTIIKTPLEETNKRSFLVSYRMMIEELHDIFPNAQIFITTVGPCAWAPSNQARDMAADHYKIAEQQRYCADLLGVSVIDWYRNGQISYLWNNVQGAGTQDDPYIWGQNLNPYPDNADLLHPNARGGKKYGRLAACVIKNNFLKIE